MSKALVTGKIVKVVCTHLWLEALGRRSCKISNTILCITKHYSTHVEPLSSKEKSTGELHKRIRYPQGFPQVSQSRSRFLIQPVLILSGRFLRREDEDVTKSWDTQLAKKYEDTLFKEFAICDLKHYKSGNVCHIDRRLPTIY